ncbi:DUF4158 domain-containing protein [Streptomyces sp. NPDC004126]|uniref:DUF4158 domain-containing protein n=1 Tax=Streptomyces sp. NPDC004126 TaxID=3390695 RepID=UPI003D063380
MATRVFSDEEPDSLRSFPAIGKDESVRYFTLTLADEAFPRKLRRVQNVLSAAVQLSTLPWLGFVPEDVPAAPSAAVGRLARRLGLAVAHMAGDGERGQTRTDHLREIAEHATDTHGVSLVDFGLFGLVGKQLSPRIRDLGKITLHRMGAKADYEERFPTAGPLLTKKASLDLVADRWDDLLRYRR